MANKINCYAYSLSHKTFIKTKKKKGKLRNGGGKNMIAAFKYRNTDAKSLFSLEQTGPGLMALNYKEKSV